MCPNYPSEETIGSKKPKITAKMNRMKNNIIEGPYFLLLVTVATRPKAAPTIPKASIQLVPTNTFRPPWSIPTANLSELIGKPRLAIPTVRRLFATSRKRIAQF